MNEWMDGSIDQSVKLKVYQALPLVYTVAKIFSNAYTALAETNVRVYFPTVIIKWKKSLISQANVQGLSTYICICTQRTTLD